MSKNDTGVFQLDNGYWGYRYAIRIDGKSRESKKVKDEFGNPFPYGATDSHESISVFGVRESYDY